MNIFRRGSNEDSKILIEDYFKKYEILEGSIEVEEYQSNPIEDFFERRSSGNIKIDLATPEERKGAELRHRLTARTTVLRTLVIPMFVIPLWLMVILTLPTINHSAINSKAYSERMQAAFLAALASSFLGLCLVVTRDLFPQGKESFDKTNELDS